MHSSVNRFVLLKNQILISLAVIVEDNGLYIRHIAISHNPPFANKNLHIQIYILGSEKSKRKSKGHC